jgi:hypothetical protein
VAQRPSLQGQSWADRALLVSITAASNADTDFARADTVVSSAPQSDFTVTFEAGYNEVGRHAIGFKGI